jgi:LysM repeat protein
MNTDTYYRLGKIAADYTTYKIQRGDNYSTIAKKLNTGVTAADIKKANPNLNPKLLQIGSSIRIPRGTRIPEWYGPSESFLDETRLVESSGGIDNFGDKVGDKAFSKGPYQIREVFPKELDKYLRDRKAQNLPASGSMYIDDINDMFGTNYTLADREDEVKAREMTRLYLIRYGRQFYRQHGRFPTNEEMYGMHNGGGMSGYNAAATAENRAKYNKVAAGRRAKRDPWIPEGLYDLMYNLSSRDPLYKTKLDAINRAISAKKAEYMRSRGK